MAESAIGTPVGTLSEQTTPVEHQQRSVSSILSKLEPDLYPLDTLTNAMPEGQKPINSKHEWASYSMYPRQDVVDENYAGGSGDQTLPVANPGRFRVNMLILAPSDPTFPMCLVKAVNANDLTIRALADGSSGGAIPPLAAGTNIVWLGTSVYQGGTVTDPQAIEPAYEYNYTQIMDTSVAVDLTKLWQKNYTSQHDYPRTKNDMRKEYRLSREFLKWFGVRSKSTTTNAAGKLRTTMNGVTRYIGKELEYDKDAPVPVPESLMIDWLAEVFAGNNGSESRYFFADTFLVAALEKTDLVNPRFRKEMTKYGVRFNQIQTDFGTLYIKHTRAFNIFGRDHYGVILDMNLIRKHTAMEMFVQPRNFREQGILQEGEYYAEESTLSIAFGNECHAEVIGV
jgi:hypothetical protein